MVSHLKKKKTEGKRCLAETMIDGNYPDDLALLANTPSNKVPSPL